MSFYPPRIRPTLLTDPFIVFSLLALTGLTAFFLSRTPSASAPIFNQQNRWGNSPLAFIANAGQTDAEVRFQANGLGGTLFFTEREVVLTIPTASCGEACEAATDSEPMQAVRVQWDGANPSTNVVGDAPLPGIANFFQGQDATEWQRNVPTYGSIQYQDLYPGISLQYEGAAHQLKGTYHVAPGADPSRIRWRYEGVAGTELDARSGTLRLLLNDGANGTPAFLTEGAPIAWQEQNGERLPVEARYALAADGSIGFVLGQYNPDLPLTIDPALTYSRFLGGSFFDGGSDLAVDEAGNSYIVGYTSSSDFPVADVAAQGIQNSSRDVVVVKLDASGNALLYRTVFGGTSFEHGADIALDEAGNVTVIGYTASFDDPLTEDVDESFPTVDPIQAERSGAFDAFVTQLDATGALTFSSYLGGDDGDYGTGIAQDESGALYLTGYTESTNFPVSDGATQTERASLWDGWAMKIADGQLVYGTYLGGTADDKAQAIVVDGAGNAYIVGQTQSGDFPATIALQGVQPLDENGFVTKLAPDGTSFGYARLLGGSAHDVAQSIAADVNGNIYVAGYTQSDDFPTQDAAFDTLAGADDAFVTKLDTSGATVYSTFLGGTRYDEATSIAALGDGSVQVAGWTSSDDFPLSDAVQAAFGGATDAFVARLTLNGAGLIYSSYLGGSGEDYAQGVAVGEDGSTYLTGYTRSDSFGSATLQGGTANQDDLFAAKLTEEISTALTIGEVGSQSGRREWAFSLLLMAVVVGFLAAGRMAEMQVARDQGAGK